MKNLEQKKNIYYGGVAFIALICASSLSQAMNNEDTSSASSGTPARMTAHVQDDEMARIRCLWNLGTNAFRSSSLELLEKKVSTEPHQTNPKLRINFIKKLGEFLKEDPNHTLQLEILRPGKDNEEAPLAKFYKETLNYIKSSRDLTDAGKAIQELKLKIFYIHLPQEHTKAIIQEIKEEIRGSFNTVKLCTGVDRNYVEYLRHSYFEDNPNIRGLENLSDKVISKEPLLGGKTNFKLGRHRETTEICNISQKQAFYNTASKTPYSLGKYYLAELYNSVISTDAGYYSPKEAFDLYVEIIVEDGEINKEGKPLAAYPLAAYKLAKFFEFGDKSFDLSFNEKSALQYFTIAAKNGHPYAQYELYLKNNKEGIEFLKQSADSGYSKAQLLLAQKFAEDASTKELSSFWYKKAAAQGEKDAYYFAAHAYETEEKPDYTRAISFYKESPDSRAQVRLGKIYLKGKGGNQSDELALGYFQEACQKNNANGHYYKGLMQFLGRGFDGPQLSLAMNSFIEASQQNQKKALFQLGVMNQFGLGTTQDFEKAKDFYEKAEKEGSSPAAYFLGNLHKRGLVGEKKDEAKALTFWEKAADTRKEHKEAAYEVGKSYLKAWLNQQGEETAKNAQKYLQKSGSAHKDALYLQGLMQELGIGCQKNLKKAIEYYEQAATTTTAAPTTTIATTTTAITSDQIAQNGHAKALFNLGKLYETSEPDKALRYYKSAADQHHGGAQHILLDRYLNNFEPAKDLTQLSTITDTLEKETTPLVLKAKKLLARKGEQKAIDWFEKKASEGNPSAQQYFGKLLEEGKILPQNMPKAIEFYEIASAKGKRSAQRRLDDLKKLNLFEALKINNNNNI